MATTSYWADNYVEKKTTGRAAIRRIRPGQRVFIGSSCGEPQHLVSELYLASDQYTDIEIVRIMALESTPLSLIAEKTHDQGLNIRSFYLGSGKPSALAKYKRFITPINLSAIPRLFKSRKLPIHVALIQVSPPDDFGWMSLGISVDVTLSAALSADLVIAQVNHQMPRVLGRSFIHVNDVDVIVEFNEPLLTVGEMPELEATNMIASHIKRLVDDGSTIQIGLGATAKAILSVLSDKNDLGIHSQFLMDPIMHLVSKGVITNRKKGYNEGKIVASNAMGTRDFYEYLHDNPSIEFFPSDYVNDPGIIARHFRMVSMNVIMAIDLTGQVACDALPYNHFSGVTGMVDFVRGAALAEGGKSILMLSSRGEGGTKSRIVPMLNDMAVVVPRGDVQYVVTEYGAVNLFGKSLQERALALISISHPDFRDELFNQAKELGLLGKERHLRDSIHGIYPLRIEETLEMDHQQVVIRPAKPDDERRIQEHYYEMEGKDIISRFFHEKSTFRRDEMENISQIDYIKNLTLIVVLGEVGFESVIGVGEYWLDQRKNMAEVAFSISKEWQKKGLSKILLRKLAAAAQENGILGLIAYSTPENQGMIKLFRGLPYKVMTHMDYEMLILSCKFDEVR
ncbi:MAG: GNAT family N-acetyltransferase [Proteobacteria bacterium]|nr:GNAT family N-acetyltransferase [Pseudomonadota bacterium]MBU4469170.1 GNAT family N-acetyltransferase [Pseudomonadota bacterium]MCG2752201.1 GNAT family N-acetyltransferase [Desulfobacteraceae bacterium]